jgi:hypothetical protein
MQSQSNSLDFRQSWQAGQEEGLYNLDRPNPAFDVIRAELAEYNIATMIEAMGSDGPLLVLSIRPSSPPPPLVVPQNIAARLGVQFDTVRARGRTVLVVWR